jgi:hypothetical protein
MNIHYLKIPNNRYRRHSSDKHMVITDSHQNVMLAISGQTPGDFLRVSDNLEGHLHNEFFVNNKNWLS